jgi:hypothetical protein
MKYKLQAIDIVKNNLQLRKLMAVAANTTDKVILKWANANDIGLTIYGCIELVMIWGGWTDINMVIETDGPTREALLKEAGNKTQS